MNTTEHRSMIVPVIEQLITTHERVKHREHQLIGVEQLVLDTDVARGRTIPNVFALLDEVGAGKTKQVIDASQILFLNREIDTMVILAPGYARSTWAEEDPILGEVAKHAWHNVPNVVHEYHGSYSDLDFSMNALHWVVTNYEFIRRENRLDILDKQLKGRRTWICADESWMIAGFSEQTRAAIKLRRRRAQRASILSGTPLSDGKPMNLYYQFKFLDEGIIGCKNKTHFKSKYCVMGGEAGRKVVDYQNLEELNNRIAPYVLARKTRDCFDLPPMLDPITLEFKLSDSTWKVYKEMRDEMVAWLGTDQVTISRQGIVKALRLAQITSGFLGGVEDVDDDFELTPEGKEPTDAQIPPWLRKAAGLPFDEKKLDINSVLPPKPKRTVEIGSEKLDGLMGWAKNAGVAGDKLLIWCRFKPELIRTTAAIKSLYPEVFNLTGGQKPLDRTAAKRALAPGSKGRAAVVGNPKAGGASLNFSAANVAVYLSNGPALIERTQSIGRIERPGATQPMLIVDVCATGPKGQRTIDHHIIKSLRSKQDMATWTVNEWRRILNDD